MKKLVFTLFKYTCLITCIYSQSTLATIIGRDLSAESTLGLISYQNDYYNAFSSGQDGAQIYQGGIDLIPSALVDNTLSGSPSDNIGIITPGNTTPFFGVVDTVNNDNPQKYIEAFWLFDITGFINLMFSIDIAAMGDFEANGVNRDYFDIEFNIDGGQWNSIFNGRVDETKEQHYTLESGSSNTLNDPLMINGALLSNQFTKFNQNISGMGSQLAIRLTAASDGGNEAMAFQHMIIQGSATNNNSIAVNEPPLVIIMLIAGLLISNRRLSARQC